MHGAVAAGHPLTAEAGAQALEAGGNAVDACLAAAFVSWVAESPLTGPGGGGFLLVHRAGERDAQLLDFFVTIPGRGLSSSAPRGEMESIDVVFGAGSTTQVFHIGHAACAVPGTFAGLESAHRAYATLPWRDLVQPAVDLARNGIELTPAQAYLHAILDVILRSHDEGREVYSLGGSRLAAGDRLVLTDLAATLERIADEGSRTFYRGELGRAVAEHVRGGGGTLTEEDLRAYRVVRRRPVRVEFDGHEFLSNPPPSSGGVLIGYGLRLLDRLPQGEASAAEAMAEVVEVMREQARVRDARFAEDLYRGGLARRLYRECAVAAALARMGRSEPRTESAASPNTTHISVVDRQGNAASLTASIGSGSGVVVPGTGIHLNNMLGEYDLNPPGATQRAGLRLTSMMAPSLALAGGRPRLVVGSAGSVRLRGAILQVAVNVLRHGMPVEEAIAHPRLHADAEHVHVEGGADRAEVDGLAALGYDIVRWRRRNLFFGGVAAVELAPDGSLRAAGDPRRGGHGVVV
ncbi:MAG: gamma-glutamyltransferase family protein [Gaiellaceae bacterium]